MKPGWFAAAAPAAGIAPSARPLLLCLSHLRWDFVYQRPQHLIVSATKQYDVVFFEEPVERAVAAAYLETRVTPEGIHIAAPVLPAGLDAPAADAAQRGLLDALLGSIAAPLSVAWYYTPMALAFTSHLRPAVTVFDSMDDLSSFRGASPRLLLLERRLLKRADLVFTGGRSLFEAKRHLHDRVYLFASNVNTAHFAVARQKRLPEPPDQLAIAGPRIGFFGVIDERMDLALVDEVAAAQPGWQIVMLGPVVKIDPATLPQRPNLHWLGMKSYAELPAYLNGWHAGFMPFAINEATRFISPTKTPEFLAAGIPVASTPVADVVADWGKDGLVEIADGAAAMVAALQTLLLRPRSAWLARVDRRLATQSWTASWAAMQALIEDVAKPEAADFWETTARRRSEPGLPDRT